MSDDRGDRGLDALFAPQPGRVGTLAARIGWTEGQLYSALIGSLFAWVVLSNAVPSALGPAAAPWSPDVAAAESPLDDPSPPTVVPAPSSSVPGQASSPVQFGSPFTPGVFSPAPGSDASGGGSAAPSDAPSPGGPPPTFLELPEPGAVRATEGGFAAASPGSPFATAGVPEGSVAVALAANRPDKVAFVRVEGEGTALVLDVDAAGSNLAPEFAALAACPITTKGWTVGHGDVALADAPTYDPEGCASGLRGDGVWTFELLAVDLTEADGLALVPLAFDPAANATAPTSPQFQVVFKLASQP